MATSPAPEPTQATQKESVFDWVASKRTQSAYTLLAIAFVLAFIPLWLGVKFGREYIFVICMTAFLPLAPAAAGLWRLAQDPDTTLDLNLARMLVLAVGGLLGFTIVMVAVSLVYQWWDTLVGGTAAWQGPEGWRVWLMILVLIAGLALIFASLQLGRTEERTNYMLRRMLYGYNAVLTGVLVLTILAVVNILVSIYWKESYDWTAQSLYALSSRSDSILQGLSKPTRIYVILPKSGETYRRTQALLDNCRAVNSKVEVTYYSPDADRDEVKQLAQQYQFTGERAGLLVVYGTPPNAEHQFINQEALTGVSENAMSASREHRYFKGETELMTALDFMEEGKQKPVFYFTQGNGELDIDDTTVRSVGVGAGQLKQRLEQENYVVKGLGLADVTVKGKNPNLVIAKDVPDDASIVVVAGPKRMSADVVAALQRYMDPPAGSSKKKGRMIVMLDPLPNGEQDLTPFLRFLGQFNVESPNNRVLAVKLATNLDDPRLIMVIANPNLGDRNTLAAAFPDPFVFYNTRTVSSKPAANAPPTGSHYRADEVFVAYDRQGPWAETDLKTPPREFLRGAHVQELQKKLAATPLPLPVTVAVSETAGGGFHQAAQGEDKPCLVVFGTSSFVSNALLSIPGNQFGPLYNVFTSTAGWLRERPASIGIEPKKPDVFQFNVATVDARRLFFLPAGLMLVGVIGLWTGVSMVRRR